MSTPYIALYPSDYLADTAHLGLTEHGVYWRMLLHYYQHCKPFPNDLDRINRLILAATPEEKRVTEYILGEFFILHQHEDSCFYWHHARADYEISQAEQKHSSAVERGKKGGRPKKAELYSSLSSAKAGLSSSLSSAKAKPKQPEPEPEPEEKYKPIRAGFEEFWKAYPKKKSKGHAQSAWNKVVCDLQTILETVERQKLTPDWNKEGGQFIPNPATWLNGKRWLDDVDDSVVTHKDWV